MHIHPPKVEYFDTVAMTNTDPKGYVRPVDEYDVTEFGLYLARPADHRQFHYLESWLLPSLSLRFTVFHFNPGHERDQRFYVDIGEFERGDDVWISRDHYLDLITHPGAPTGLEDTDELLGAFAAGLLTAEQTERAITAATLTTEAIAAHGFDPMAWLDSVGMPLHWR